MQPEASDATAPAMPVKGTAMGMILYEKEIEHSSVLDYQNILVHSRERDG
jgi:hypothetical protein